MKWYSPLEKVGDAGIEKETELHSRVPDEQGASWFHSGSGSNVDD
jgi:hypothetical protein